MDNWKKKRKKNYLYRGAICLDIFDHSNHLSRLQIDIEFVKQLKFSSYNW